MNKADRAVKKIEEGREELIDYLNKSVNEISFNKLCDMGINRNTLSRFKKGESINIDSLLKMKKCIDLV